MEIVHALKAVFGSLAVSGKNLQPLIENLLYYLKVYDDETALLIELVLSLKQISDILKVKESSVQTCKRLISLLFPLKYKIRASGL